MRDKKAKRLGYSALKKIRDMERILELVYKNKNDIAKLKNKKGLCPQSLII